MNIEFYFPPQTCVGRGAGIRICYGCAEGATNSSHPCVSARRPQVQTPTAFEPEEYQKRLRAVPLHFRRRRPSNGCALTVA